MALLFGLGRGKDDPPTSKKTGTARKTSRAKVETKCPEGKSYGGSCPAPVRNKVKGNPNPKGEPKENPPTEIVENKEKPKKDGSYKNTLMLGN
jgi:hypothetical protein